MRTRYAIRRHLRASLEPVEKQSFRDQQQDRDAQGVLVQAVKRSRRSTRVMRANSPGKQRRTRQPVSRLGCVLRWSSRLPNWKLWSNSARN